MEEGLPTEATDHVVRRSTCHGPGWARQGAAQSATLGKCSRALLRGSGGKGWAAWCGCEQQARNSRNANMCRQGDTEPRLHVGPRYGHSRKFGIAHGHEMPAHGRCGARSGVVRTLSGWARSGRSSFPRRLGPRRPRGPGPPWLPRPQTCPRRLLSVAPPGVMPAGSGGSTDSASRWQSGQLASRWPATAARGAD